MITNSMKKTSLIAEIEFKFSIAVNCPGYPIGEGNPYYNTILEYIELFYSSSDVIAELKPYFKVFTSEDTFSLRDQLKQKLLTLEKL